MRYMTNGGLIKHIGFTAIYFSLHIWIQTLNCSCHRRKYSFFPNLAIQMEFFFFYCWIDIFILLSFKLRKSRVKNLCMFWLFCVRVLWVMGIKNFVYGHIVVESQANSSWSFTYKRFPAFLIDGFLFLVLLFLRPILFLLPFIRGVVLLLTVYILHTWNFKSKSLQTAVQTSGVEWQNESGHL